jgi:hypothetical protein
MNRLFSSFLESTVIKFMVVNTEINILRSIHRRTENVVVRLCSGEEQATADHAFLKSAFGSANGEKASYLHDFVVKVFPGKVDLRRRVSLLLQDEHIIVLCFYFSC